MEPSTPSTFFLAPMMDGIENMQQIRCLQELSRSLHPVRKTIGETKARMRRAFRGEKQGAFIGFASLELLWKVLTPKRWDIVRAMTGTGPLAIRALARRVERDLEIGSRRRAGAIEGRRCRPRRGWADRLSLSRNPRGFHRARGVRGREFYSHP